MNKNNVNIKKNINRTNRKLINQLSTITKLTSAEFATSAK